MVEAMFVLNLVETVGILVGVTIAIIEIRKSREERRFQLTNEFLKLSEKQYQESWNSLIKMDFTTYEEWSEKYGAYTNPEAFQHLMAFMNTFETMGKNVIDGLVDLDFVLYRIGPVTLFGLWEKCLPIVNEWRRRYNHPEFWEGLEFLYNEMKKKHPNVTFIPNPQRQRLMQR